MNDLSPAVKAKFRGFHEAYENARRSMLANGMHGAVVAVKVWERALSAVPLTRTELMQYKILLAKNRNDSELFN